MQPHICFHEAACREWPDPLQCQTMPRSIADIQPERRVPRKLSGWTRLNAEIDLPKLTARYQSFKPAQASSDVTKNWRAPLLAIDKMRSIDHTIGPGQDRLEIFMLRVLAVLRFKAVR